MTSGEVRKIVELEIGNEWDQVYPHGVDLRKCLVEPRRCKCHNTFPKFNEGRPLDLWVVLEETPNKKDGYLIVFDEETRRFGLASWNKDTVSFLGFYGTFINTLRGM